MKITLKDGSVKEYAESKSVYDIALDISEGLARVACCGKVDGKVVDLRTVIDHDCELSICTANDKEGLATIRHTTSHVMAEAVKKPPSLRRQPHRPRWGPFCRRLRFQLQNREQQLCRQCRLP